MASLHRYTWEEDDAAISPCHYYDYDYDDYTGQTTGSKEQHVCGVFQFASSV